MDGKAALIARAKKLLRERTASPRELLERADDLRNAELFDLARRLLALAREKPIAEDALRLELARKHAVSTYKDPDLPLVERLDEALEILRQASDLERTTDRKTLATAGSILKQKWYADGHQEHLAIAIAYLRRGCDGGIDGDGLRNAINAAFVLDLLADLERRGSRPGVAPPPSVLERGEDARRLREEIIATLAPQAPGPLAEKTPTGGDAPPKGDKESQKRWWLQVTLGEALFGLQRYEEAGTCLAGANRIADVAPWQQAGAARQLASLARLQSALDGGKEDRKRWQALASFLSVSEEVARDAFIGRVGLALSGGGFRASLFHIGVLAALAEWDVLRRVEVLSCVSGGSIVGLHYYLELQNLLSTRKEEEIQLRSEGNKEDDYVAIVKRLASDFVAGVQTNIRMRAFADLGSNLKMVAWPAYSRTHRLGEVYEQQLFKRVRDGKGEQPRFMDDLRFDPCGAKARFNPRLHNWRRRAKVPQLIVNAAALNTGHQWQFTASFMGEPPGLINTKVDGNYRLRRLYYDEAPSRYKRFRQGTAVAASSCVPGLFPPIDLPDLYPGRTVHLVDGGVHDNQGIAGLVEQDCDTFLVSDASGQMGELDAPPSSAPGVLTRSNSILQARLRDVQFRDLASRERAAVVDALFIHLKQGLDVVQQDWIGCDDPKLTPKECSGAASFTAYGIRKDVQRQLASVRTDLDTFCDAEAFALMTSGYHMMRCQLESKGGLFTRPKEPVKWEFLEIEERMLRTHPQDRLMRILQVADRRFLRLWKLDRGFRWLASAWLAGGVLLLGLGLRSLPATALEAGYSLLMGLAIAVGVVAILNLMLATLGSLAALVRGRRFDLAGLSSRFLLGMALLPVGWILVNAYLRFVDPRYRTYGRLSELSREDAPFGSSP